MRVITPINVTVLGLVFVGNMVATAWSPGARWERYVANAIISVVVWAVLLPLQDWLDQRGRK